MASIFSISITFTRRAEDFEDEDEHEDGFGDDFDDSIRFSEKEIKTILSYKRLFRISHGNNIQGINFLGQF